MGTKHVR